MADDKEELEPRPWHGGPWKKGQSGNPKGRPKGTRHKFSQAFYDDLLLEWQKGGREVMKKVRENDPATFLRVAASILPKDINVNTTEEVAFDRLLEGLEDEQLNQLIVGLCALGSGRTGEEVIKKAKTPRRFDQLH